MHMCVNKQPQVVTRMWNGQESNVLHHTPDLVQHQEMVHVLLLRMT